MTLTVVGDPTEIRSSVHHQLLAVTRSEGGFSYALAETRGGVTPVALAATAFPVEVAVQQFTTMQNTLLPAILRTMRSKQKPRFYSARQAYGPRRTSNPLWESLATYEIVDHARMLVFDGSRFVAKVGAIRLRGEPAYSLADLRAANRIAGDLSTLLITADRIERAALPEEGCDLLCSASGDVDYASDAGIRWLSRLGRRDWVRSVVLAADRGEEAAPRADVAMRVVRLVRGTSCYYLVQLKPPPSYELPETSRLSGRQREVAELLTLGCTVPEVARHLGSSVDTVRSHVREIYRRLAIASRAELVRILAAEPTARSNR